MMNQSIIYALDFDGVICDSAVETAITGWRAAGKLWQDMPESVPQEMIDRFREVRPIIETGYEAILAMRLLCLGRGAADIYRGFADKSRALMQEAQIGVDGLKKLFGETRDNWIAGDLSGWIAMNPLFDGVAAKLRQLHRQSLWYVVTTKQERFVKHILQANAIDLPDERIFGLDRNMSKADVLKWLLQFHSEHRLYFVEDRLPTLMNVQRYGELAAVKLIFAMWGYNTAEDRTLAARNGLFTCQQLEDFLR
jgi:phosphoglycolate phosphatase-like HAD superfamily hydrolase